MTSLTHIAGPEPALLAKSPFQAVAENEMDCIWCPAPVAAICGEPAWDIFAVRR